MSDQQDHTETPNVFADTFSVERGGLRGEPVARKAGSELIGGTLYELAERSRSN